MRYTAPIIAILLSVVAAIGAGASVPSDTVSYRMDLQRYLYPQEKVHVTTDQGRYVAGDTVWLRAFVVDAATHRPVAMSRYVYVELQDPMGRTETRIRLRHDSAGVFAGYLPLSEEMPEGDYTMHAYTAFMENQGRDYFFMKRLPVMSPLAGRATIVASMEPGGDRLTLHVADVDAPDTPVYFKEMVLVTPKGRTIQRGPAKKAETVRLNADELRAGVVQVRFDNYSRYVGLPVPDTDTLSVAFFPEGGYLVAGCANRVGVKALDSGGRGADVTGRVLDSDGTEVATFTTIHRGMGTLVLVPQPGQIYRAEVAGRTCPLPAVNDNAAVVQADVIGRDNIAVGTSGSVPDGATLVLHSRGRMLYAGEAPAPDTPLLLPKADIAGGVTSLLLIDGQGNTLSERLFFAWPDTVDIVWPQVSISDGNDGLKRLHISLPEGADVVVSVLDGSLAEADSATTIASTLLLQSDLRGHIEDGGWYFRGDHDRRTEAAMDALMLTQGWRRYDIPSVIAGRMSDPQLPLEQGSEIGGTVRTLWRNKPIEGAQVNVLAPTLNLARVVTTDASGRFTVSDVEFPEDTRFVVQSLNKKGGYEQNFTIDTVAYPALKPLVMPVQARHPDSATADVTVAKDYTTRMHYADGRLEVRLSDVTVQGYRPQDIEDPYEMLASRSLDVNAIERESGPTSYDELLRRIPGITYDYTKGDVLYRGEPVEFWINSTTRFNLNLAESETALGIKYYKDKGTSFSPYGQSPDVNQFKSKRLATAFNAEPPKMGWSDFIVNMFAETYPIQDIKRVDLIPSGMSLVFGSIRPVLNFTTKGPADMVADRPYQLKLISPLGFQKSVERYQPAYDMENQNELRSTLYWLPVVRGQIEIEVPEFITTSIVVEGTYYYGLLD